MTRPAKIVMLSLAILLSVVPSSTPAQAAAGALDVGFDGDGRVMTSFGTGGGSSAVAIQANGKIVAVGGDGRDFAIARYNTDGSRDTGFDEDGKVTTDFGGDADAANSVAIQHDGRIVVAGRSGTDFAFARYNTNGSLDGGFDLDGRRTLQMDDGSVNALVIQPDGKIVAAGVAEGDFAVIRLFPDGSRDVQFGSMGVATTDFHGTSGDSANAVVLQPDGKIVAVGTTRGDTEPPPYAGDSNFALARYNVDGSPDPEFGPGGTGTVTSDVGYQDEAAAIVLQPVETGFRIVAAGHSSHHATVSDVLFGGGRNFALIAYSQDGLVDPSFGLAGTATTDFGDSRDAVHGLTLQGGKLVAAGVGGGSENFALARYTLNGSLDSTFGANGKVTTSFDARDAANAIAVQADGKVVVVGTAGNGTFALARYLSS